MPEQQEKAELDAQSETQMREYLRSRTWEEKVEAIRRMNEFGKIARAAMKEATDRARPESAE